MEVQSHVKDDQLPKDPGSVLSSSPQGCPHKVGLLLVLLQAFSGQIPALQPEKVVGWLELGIEIGISTHRWGRCELELLWSPDLSCALGARQ